MKTHRARWQPDLKPYGRPAQMTWMLGISLAVHALVLSVSFLYPKHAPAPVSEPLEVILVNTAGSNRPLHARALAQADLDGGGNTDAQVRAQSPLPATGDTTLAMAERQRKVAALEAQARALLSQLKSTQTVPDAAARNTQTTDTENVPGDAAEDQLAASLEAQVARDWTAYEKRPKRRFIGASTQEYRFARYVENWRLRVERIGNLNYPEDARNQRLYGQLQLTVAIRADGKVDSIEVTRSSGQPLLDKAAVHIVRLAAPFSPLPASIRRDTDILSITRTWTFTHDDRLTSE